MLIICRMAPRGIAKYTNDIGRCKAGEVLVMDSIESSKPVIMRIIAKEILMTAPIIAKTFLALMLNLFTNTSILTWAPYW